MSGEAVGGATHGASAGDDGVRTVPDDAEPGAVQAVDEGDVLARGPRREAADGLVGARRDPEAGAVDVTVRITVAVAVLVGVAVAGPHRARQAPPVRDLDG